MPCLSYACQFGSAEMVEALIDAGANLQAGDEDGDTPLHCAIWGGNTAARTCSVAQSQPLSTHAPSTPPHSHFHAA